MAGHGMSGAEYLASIYGTEKDKTILLKNLYHNPVIDMRQADAFSKVGQRNDQEQQYFDDFFEELFVEIDTKYGKIEEMNVCDNIGEHMIGNVYVKFYREEDAEKAKNALEDRWFNGEPIYAELSPVTDFREACCRQYELGGCQKGAFCNFMHLKPISRELKRKLYGNRARSPERYPRGRRGGGGGGGRDRDRDYGGRRDRDRDYDRRDRGGDRYDDRRGGGDRRERRRSRDRDYR